MKLQDYFDRIEVINLPERTDRKKEIIKELEKMGCPIGNNVRIFPAIKPESLNGFPSKGAYGCFLSHEAVINQALKDKVQHLLILEDDLLLRRAFFEYGEKALGELHEKKWNFLYLGHFLPKKPFPPHIQKLNGSLQCAHFFALNCSILQPLSEFLKEIRERPPGHPDGGPMHVDGAYNLFRIKHPECLTWICYPSLGIQRSSRSAIAEPKWHDQLPIFRHVVNYFRSIKNWLKSKY